MNIYELYMQSKQHPNKAEEIYVLLPMGEVEVVVVAAVPLPAIIPTQTYTCACSAVQFNPALLLSKATHVSPGIDAQWSKITFLTKGIF